MWTTKHFKGFTLLVASCPCTLSNSFFNSSENQRSSWKHTQKMHISNFKRNRHIQREITSLSNSAMSSAQFRHTKADKKGGTQRQNTFSEACKSWTSCRRRTRSSLSKKNTCLYYKLVIFFHISTFLWNNMSQYMMFLWNNMYCYRLFQRKTATIKTIWLFLCFFSVFLTS